MLVKAGAAVDATIDTLTPLLEEGDQIIDGGNEWSAPTPYFSMATCSLSFHLVQGLTSDAILTSRPSTLYIIVLLIAMGQKKLLRSS